ncbi:hypothetical protein DFJ77DRAFT_467729 [Powellomyces hirtus]|nr:hypothetical protein DFJ77DRAFT_467729 [Powellomyces hirtus]
MTGFSSPLINTNPKQAMAEIRRRGPAPTDEPVPEVKGESKNAIKENDNAPTRHEVVGHPERPPPELALSGRPIDHLVLYGLLWFAGFVGLIFAWITFFGNNGLGGTPFPAANLDEPLYASSKLEVAGRFPFPPVGIAVTDDGRIFATSDGSHGDGDKLGYFDPSTGEYTAFPSKKHQGIYNTPLSLALHEDVLYMVDHGNHAVGGYATLFAFNVTSNKAMPIWRLPITYGSRVTGLSVVKGSDSDQFSLLMADSSMMRGNPMLMRYVPPTLRLDTVLAKHESLAAGPHTLHSPAHGGKTLKWAWGKFLPYRPAISSIAADKDWVYYAAQSATKLYRVPLAATKNQSMDKDLIETVSTDKPVSGGMVAHNGIVYIADQQSSAIRVFDPKNPETLRTLVRDPALLTWPEQVAVGKDGYLYIACSALDAALTGRRHHAEEGKHSGIVVRVPLL